MEATKEVGFYEGGCRLRKEKNSLPAEPLMMFSNHRDMRKASSLARPSLLWFGSSPFLTHSFSGACLEIYPFPFLYSSITWQSPVVSAERWRGLNEVFSTRCKYTVSYSLSLVSTPPSILPSLSSPTSHYPLSPLLFPRQQAYWPLNPPIFLLWRHSKLKQRREMECLLVNM